MSSVPTTRVPRQTVFIITDTMGPKLLGCYGSQLGLTPNLDRFAGQSVRFEHAYTPCPLCTPARSALYTGQPAAVNGAWSLEMPIGQGVPTIVDRLADGRSSDSSSRTPGREPIRAAHIGKWHLSATDYFDTGTAPAGWDPDWWFDGRAHLESLPADVRPRTRRVPRDGEAPIAREHTFGGAVTDRARSFLKQHGQSDFFLAVSYDEPHAPFVSPHPFAGRYTETGAPIGANARDSLSDKPKTHRRWRADAGMACPAGAAVTGDRYYHPDYYACTAFVDDEIGRLVRSIDEYAPGALVIITSDHGDMMGGHGLFKKGPAMYEEIVRVPLLMRTPAALPADGAGTPGAELGAAAVVSTAVSLLDLVPTWLAWFGVPGPGWLSGRSLLEIAGEPDDADRPVFLEFGRFSPYNNGRGEFLPIRAVVTAREKLVLNLLDSDEYYDLETDPAELENCIEAVAHAGRRNELHDLLTTNMDNTRDPFRGTDWIARPWRNDASDGWRSGGMPRRGDVDEAAPLDYTTGEEKK